VAAAAAGVPAQLAAGDADASDDHAQRLVPPAGGGVGQLGDLGVLHVQSRSPVPGLESEAEGHDVRAAGHGDGEADVVAAAGLQDQVAEEAGVAPRRDRSVAFGQGLERASEQGGRGRLLRSRAPAQVGGQDAPPLAPAHELGADAVAALVVEGVQSVLYHQWIANRRRLIALIDEMEEVSRQAAEILLAQPHTPEPRTALPAPRPAPVTRHLAQAVAHLAELIEPVAEAAQEWLESKDDDDREAIAEARERLLAAVIEAPDLASTAARLARLLGTAAWPQ
jgi:hypothetical protein